MLASAVEHLVKGIVDHPDEVQVGSANSPRGEVIEVRVHPDDLGRVIGRSGRTAKALRTLVTALADGRRVRVDVAPTEEAGASIPLLAGVPMPRRAARARRPGIRSASVA